MQNLEPEPCRSLPEAQPTSDAIHESEPYIKTLGVRAEESYREAQPLMAGDAINCGSASPKPFFLQRFSAGADLLSTISRE